MKKLALCAVIALTVSAASAGNGNGNGNGSSPNGRPFQAIHSELDALGALLLEAEQRHMALVHRIDRMELSFQAQIDALNAEVGNLQRENLRLQAWIDQVAQTAGQNAADIAAIYTEIQNIDQQIDALRFAVGDNDAEIAALNQSMQALIAELDAIDANLMDAIDDIAVNELLIAQLQQDVEELSLRTDVTEGLLTRSLCPEGEIDFDNATADRAECLASVSNTQTVWATPYPCGWFRTCYRTTYRWVTANCPTGHRITAASWTRVAGTGRVVDQSAGYDSYSVLVRVPGSTIRRYSMTVKVDAICAKAL